MKERDFCPLYEKRCSALMRVRSFSPILNVRELIGRASSIGISQRVILWKNRFHFVRMTWRLNDCNHFSILFPYFWFFLLFCSQTELSPDILDSLSKTSKDIFYSVRFIWISICIFVARNSKQDRCREFVRGNYKTSTRFGLTSVKLNAENLSREFRQKTFC